MNTGISMQLTSREFALICAALAVARHNVNLYDMTRKEYDALFKKFDNEDMTYACGLCGPSGRDFQEDGRPDS